MPFRNHYDRGQNINDSKLTRGFPGSSVVKNLLANAGDTGSIPRSGRSSGEENSKPH